MSLLGVGRGLGSRDRPSPDGLRWTGPPGAARAAERRAGGTSEERVGAPDGRRDARVRTGTGGCACDRDGVRRREPAGPPEHGGQQGDEGVRPDHLPRPARVGGDHGGVLVGRHEAERLVHAELGRGHRGQQGPPGHGAPEDQHARAEDHGGHQRQARSGGHRHRRPRCGRWRHRRRRRSSPPRRGRGRTAHARAPPSPPRSPAHRPRRDRPAGGWSTSRAAARGAGSRRAPAGAAPTDRDGGARTT